MLRAVIDTSTLVSYALTKSALLGRLVDSWRSGVFVVLSSPDTRDELTRVLQRPSIQQRVAVSLDPLIAGFERYTENVPGLVSLSGACRDPKDDKFLACAVKGRGAQYLVSSDADLLDMRRYDSVAIVNPGQFVLVLELYDQPPEVLSRRHNRAVLENILAYVSLDPDTAQCIKEALALQSGPHVSSA